MTALDDVRDWVGSEPDDAAVEVQLIRFEGLDFVVERAALSILLRREADGGPAKWSVDGDYSEDDTAGRKSLLAKISRLRAIVGDVVSDLPPLTSAALHESGR